MHTSANRNASQTDTNIDADLDKNIDANSDTNTDTKWWRKCILSGVETQMLPECLQAIIKIV